MKKVIFVSSADSNYFPLLAEWVHSIQRFPESAGMDIGILNAGMKSEELDYLRSQGCIVVEAEWPIPLSPRRIKGREFLKSCICRPFLPEYFPGYETICWMDADTWVQRWDVIPYFLKAAQNGNMALTAQVDRAHPRQIRVKWLGLIPVKISGFYISNAKKSLGMGMAKKLYPYSIMLAGMFAMRSDAPHWKRWQELLRKTLRKGNIFTAEQLTLGVLCHVEKYPVDILPAWMHWLCTYPTFWDDESKMFTECYTPHEKIGVLHLSGVDEMRLNRQEKMSFKTQKGDSIEQSFRYPYLEGDKVLIRS